MEGFSILSPQGAIGLAERGLMLHALEFMLIVAVPVFFLLFFFAWKYRASNTKATYLPDWEHAKMDELIWWAIPFEIVLVLGALTWGSTHELDPRKALASEVPPLVIQVVALDWKWLFIYPEQNIATVNYLRIPVNTPIHFEITADAPMNSFWIPDLGGQIYAMTGMVNELNLMANKEGNYRGMSANYSGDGFAKMKFTTEVISQEEFEDWKVGAKASSRYLSDKEYQTLAKPSETEEMTYAEVVPNLYDTIIEKFTGPAGSGHVH